MAEKALDESSPLYLSGALLDGWYAPSLRGDPNTGLGRWTEDDIHAFLKNGRNGHAVVFGSMADAFNNSTQFMTDDDLEAISHYLKLLPGDPARDGTPWQYDEGAARNVALPAREQIPGAQTFMAKCSFCHGADGRGKQQWIPPLAGSDFLKADRERAIRIVTKGLSGPITVNGKPYNNLMPPQDQLTNDQAADALTYVMNSWGNNFGTVSADEVKAVRNQK